MSIGGIRRGLFDASRTADRPPLGVKILCVLMTMVFLVAAVQTMWLYLLVVHPIYFEESVGVRGIAAATAILLIVAGIVLLYGIWIYGLWTVKPWAWLVTQLMYVIGIPFSIVELEFFGVLVSLVIIAYLWYIREQFGFSRQFPWVAGSSPFTEA